MDFLSGAQENVNDGKKAMLLVKMFQRVLNIVFSSFLASLQFLGFMSFEFGVNMLYPGACLSFFGQLLSLFNFDLLSEYPIFDIPYEPEEIMAEPYNFNFG